MIKKQILTALLLFCAIGIYAKGRADSPVPSEVTEITVTPEEIEIEIQEEHLEDEGPLLPKYTFRQPEGQPVQLRESWGYVSQIYPEEYDSSMPLTDVCLFSAEVNCYGELVSVPNRSKIKTGNARCHLVITCESKSLSHFILQPKTETRKNLLKQIVKAAQPYDGVQIDFEYVPVRDRKNFILFLADLRYMLGKAKWFTVCVPARFKLLSEDVYPYTEIARYCDRVFIMAYDEHWSTSKPGPVASVEWCRKVMDYAIKSIPHKKLIMGIPFYGRTWGDEKTDKAWYFSSIDKKLTEERVEEIVYDEDIPTFKYTKEIEVTGFMNDAYSAVQLARMYEEAGIHKMGYWRIGMEDPNFWNWVKINKNIE